MSLTYCPNCRESIDEETVGWICQRSVRENMPSGAATESPAGLDAYGKQERDASAGAFYYKMNRLCETYNESGTDVCSGCNKQKHPDDAVCACSNRDCLSELPRLDGVDPRTITITGPSGSGKTHYIIALTKWWDQGLEDYDLTPTSVMGARIQRTFEFYRDTILNKQKVELTVASNIISFSWKLDPPLCEERKSLLISLPDVSGENLRTAAGVKASRYYHNTSGVIFLLDGEAIESILPPYDDGQEEDPIAVSRRPFNWHKDVAQMMIGDIGRRKLPRELSDMPVAICVNKMDFLRKHDGEWQALLAEEPPPHSGAFPWHWCNDRSKLIRELLERDPEAKSTTSYLAKNFKNHMFFAAATIGSSSAGAGRTLRWRPQQVEYPFLYILWALGQIPAV